MKLIKIQNAFVRADQVGSVELGYVGRKRVIITIQGSFQYWDFASPKIARQERDRVVREWKAAMKPMSNWARLIGARKKSVATGRLGEKAATGRSTPRTARPARKT